MRLLGISAFHRDSAAAIVVDGVPIAAAQEERFTRKRLDTAFPRRAARFCLDRAGLSSDDIDRVVFYEKPLRKFERTLATQLQAFPRSSKTFTKGMFLWLGDRLWLKGRISEELAVPPDKVAFVEHQRAHAASAFFASPFDEAAVLTLDDMGEWATVTLGQGRGKQLDILSEVHFPASLGLWTSAFVQFLGFEPGVDEEKLEALSHLGTPRFEREIAQTIPQASDGSFTVDPKRFRFAYDGESLFDASLAEALGPARMPGSPVRMGDGDTRDADIAASVQRVLEERVLALAVELKKRVPLDNLCVAGEVARNRTLIARLVSDGPFKNVFVPPAPGESGAALGAALEYHCSIEGGERRFRQSHSGFGESVDDRAEDGARTLGSLQGACGEMARRLAAGELVGWARGAMEFSAKSTGNRVILGDARAADGRERLLSAVQQHEPFMPCCVAVTAERANQYFEVPAGCEQALRSGLLIVKSREAARSAAPSALMHDGSAWVQVVDAASDAQFHAVLTATAEHTGAPLLLLSTLNLRGVPMARSEADSVEVFRRSSLDALIVADRIYERVTA
jgi:carbamoyltransferase